MGRTSETTINFKSSGELADTLRCRNGIDLYITQLSNGPQNGSFYIRRSLDGIIICELTTTQDISVEGARNPAFIPVIIPEGKVVDHGHEIKKGSIITESLSKKRNNQTSNVLYAGSKLSVVQLPSHSLKENINADAINILEQSNSLSPRYGDYKRLADYLQTSPRCFNRTLEEWLLLIEQVASNSAIERNNNPKVDIGLAAKLITMGYTQFPETRLRLSHLCESLSTCKNTIYRVCHEEFGCTPMRMIKAIRLEQVKTLIEQPEACKKLKLSSIKEIANYYGFSDQKRLRKEYSKLFGELPSQTLHRNWNRFFQEI